MNVLIISHGHPDLSTGGGERAAYSLFEHLKTAPGIGRVVFAALHKPEFIALILLLILVRIGGRSRELFGLCAGLATIMIIQSVWLLPELSSRAQSIIEGVEPGPSIAHAAYSILELLKLLLLLYFGFRSMHTAVRAS